MRRRKPTHNLISILVPLGGDDPFRKADWEWLKVFYETHLGCEAEIIVGRDRQSSRRLRKNRPFSKTCAVNEAFSRSRGDIICILDSDCLIDPKVILHCAERIRKALARGINLWFVPYREIFRMTPQATGEIIDSPPWHPILPSDPPPPCDVENSHGSGPSHGRDYGAMIMILPRVAFETVGGMETRARGWGADDICFLLALDCLWSWPHGHKNTPNDVLHLWHTKIDSPDPVDRAPWRTRMWAAQETPGINDWLSMCYMAAKNSPKSMRKLVDDGLNRK